MSQPIKKWDDLAVYWVDDIKTLEQLINEIHTSQIVALDTEFIKRSTYYPILALVQINTGKAIYLIDALCFDLQNLWQALTQVPEMICYACSEDLGIFYLLANCPPLTNIFDVQIGLSYLTGKTQIGYSGAVNEILNIQLDKTESQSNWLLRPLTKEQENYAADDVRYLLALHQTIKSKLQQKQLYTYALEDSLLYAKEIYLAHHTPDDQLYLDYIIPNYGQKQLAVLQKLVAWRETLAKSTNQPKSFIISKQALREIIERLPSTMQALAQTTINRHTLRVYGQEILRQIKIAKSLPKSQLPPKASPIYTSKNKPFKNALEKAIHQYSQKTGVPKHLLLKNRWIKELLFLVYQELPPTNLSDGLQGYRYDWVVNELLPILANYKQDIQKGFGISA